MSSYLCIDPGLSHTGFAVSGSTHLVETLTTIHTKDKDRLLAQILSIIREQKPDELVKKMNNMFIGKVSFIKKSTEQMTKYFRVQVPAFNDRKKSLALQRELQKADKQMASAFLVPNPNKIYRSTTSLYLAPTHLLVLLFNT